MRKKLSIFVVCIALAFSTVLVGCNNKGDNNNKPIDSEYIVPVDLDAEITAELADEYVPDVSKIKQYEGSIHVHMILGKVVPGWKAVAKEYMRIQGNAVNVVIDENQSAASYADNLRNALNSSNTDWDIVQGNYQNTLITSKGLNMYTGLVQQNPYAGEGLYWDEVLSEDAYQTDKSGTDSSVYIMNSESLSTGWFVNMTAFRAAVEKGYKNADGKAEMPVTWDDLISLCSYMKQAGYTNPLGLAGDAESISSSQFSWLFRVYGDQYYRECTDQVIPQEGDFNYDPSVTFVLKDEDPQPEGDPAYLPSAGRLMNLLFDKTSPSYVGATSDKFAEFLEQLYKMKEYLPADFQSLSQNNVRDRFQFQTGGMSAPQIFVDYSGYYLTHTASSDSVGEIDYFDYPYMVGDEVSFKSVRDVGGNGGYLSIVKHDSAQDALNLDFVKFFLSPYGQSIYYRALEAAGVAPDGLSTVQNADGESLSVVPASWKEFFANDVLKFNGLCDMSQFTNNLIYHFTANPDTVSKNKELVWYLFDGSIQIKDYQEQWYNSLFQAYQQRCKMSGWSEEMYLHPEKDPTQI